MVLRDLEQKGTITIGTQNFEFGPQEELGLLGQLVCKGLQARNGLRRLCAPRSACHLRVPGHSHGRRASVTARRRVVGGPRVTVTALHSGPVSEALIQCPSH
jgi:hypothetical protein